MSFDTCLGSILCFLLSYLCLFDFYCKSICGFFSWKEINLNYRSIQMFRKCCWCVCFPFSVTIRSQSEKSHTHTQEHLGYVYFQDFGFYNFHQMDHSSCCIRYTICAPQKWDHVINNKHMKTHTSCLIRGLYYEGGFISYLDNFRVNRGFSVLQTWFTSHWSMLPW